MKIEVNVLYYTRFKSGKIMPNIAYNQSSLDYWLSNKDIIKTASTPQELIEVGDLVKLKHCNVPMPIIYVSENGVMPIEKEECVGFEFVEAIYTPNEDKTVYTLQYSKEVE